MRRKRRLVAAPGLACDEESEAQLEQLPQVAEPVQQLQRPARRLSFLKS